MDDSTRAVIDSITGNVQAAGRAKSITGQLRQHPQTTPIRTEDLVVNNIDVAVAIRKVDTRLLAHGAEGEHGHAGNPRDDVVGNGNIFRRHKLQDVGRAEVKIEGVADNGEGMRQRGPAIKGDPITPDVRRKAVVHNGSPIGIIRVVFHDLE